LAALKAKESFSARSSERTWLVSILKNKIVDHFRRAVREQNLTEPELLPCELERPFLTSGELSRHWNPDLKPLDWGPNPETALDKKEFWDCLQRCIETLPTRLGQVFVRRELDQVSTDEICAELNVTAGNLWVMLHRARMQLRRCLEVNWIGKDTERGATSK